MIIIFIIIMLFVSVNETCVCLRLSAAAIASFLSKHLPAISLHLFVLLLRPLWSVYYFWQYVLAQKMSTTCACQASPSERGFSHMFRVCFCTELHCQSVSQSVIQRAVSVSGID